MDREFYGIWRKNVGDGKIGSTHALFSRVSRWRYDSVGDTIVSLTIETAARISEAPSQNASRRRGSLRDVTLRHGCLSHHFPREGTCMSTTTARTETEQDLIQRAQTAVSSCNWEVGQCAALWTKRFARGRTDADFAMLVGLTGDQVYQRRRVWETFGDVSANYPSLKWSHFYSALNWDDAAECLQWANDIGSTVAEMKAWRRAQRGEDLTADANEDELGWLPSNPVEVRIPGDGSEVGGSAGGARSEAVPVMAGAPRQSDPNGEGYAPFNATAMMPPPTEAAMAERPAPTFEQIARRLTGTLERCLAAISADEFADEFASLPDKDRKRLKKVLAQLGDKVGDLH